MKFSFNIFNDKFRAKMIWKRMDYLGFFKRTKKFNLNIKLDPLCNICVAVNTSRVNLSLMIHTNTIIIITLCMWERKNKNRNIFSVENLLLNDLISKIKIDSAISIFRILLHFHRERRSVTAV